MLILSKIFHTNLRNIKEQRLTILDFGKYSRTFVPRLTVYIIIHTFPIYLLENVRDFSECVISLLSVFYVIVWEISASLFP